MKEEGRRNKGSPRDVVKRKTGLCKRHKRKSPS